MKLRSDQVKISHHEFQSLMRDYASMAIECNNKRLTAKCANICLSQVVTGVISGDEDKKLCYTDDNNYIAIARKALG